MELIFKQLGIDPTATSTLRGIIEEGDMEDATDEGMDSPAGAQKIEHYGISGCGSAAYLAEMLGFEGIAKRLRLTLTEEQQADTKLNFLAKNIINPRAQLVEEGLSVK